MGRAGRGRVGSCRAATEMSQERKWEPRPDANMQTSHRPHVLTSGSSVLRRGGTQTPPTQSPSYLVYNRGKVPFPVPIPLSLTK